MSKKKFRTVIKYRGSRDGWMSQDFHKLCDDIGPTVSLFKIKENGQVVGGFTSAQWGLKDIRSSQSPTILFNLTTKTLFKCKNEEICIVPNKKWGPTFGVSELAAFEQFNGMNNGKSIANVIAFDIPVSLFAKKKQAYKPQMLA